MKSDIGEYSVEAAQDLEAQYGLDIEAELLKMLQEEIAIEMVKEIKEGRSGKL